MKVEELMTREVLTVGTDTPLKEVARLLRADGSRLFAGRLP